jgi:hypothetical protein
VYYSTYSSIIHVDYRYRVTKDGAYHTSFVDYIPTGIEGSQKAVTTGMIKLAGMSTALQ